MHTLIDNKSKQIDIKDVDKSVQKIYINTDSPCYKKNYDLMFLYFEERQEGL